MPRYRVMVDDNFHYQDADERWDVITCSESQSNDGTHDLVAHCCDTTRRGARDRPRGRDVQRRRASRAPIGCQAPLICCSSR